MRYIRFFLIFLLLLALMIYPFIPGKYDSIGIPLSTMVQIWSGLGLLTCIPAMLWLYNCIKYRKEYKEDLAVQMKLRLYFKIYAWTTCFVLLLVIFLTMLGLSILLGVFLLIGLAYFLNLLLKKTFSLKANAFHSFYTPLGLLLLPIVLLAFQLLISKPLTRWTRNRVIHNSRELIDEIERYKVRHGKYPLTLNGTWKDYNPGIKGVEKYYYTYDDTTYNLYFEQPRFFFDQFGVREFVVYNPHDTHVILSHASWNMHLEPAQLRNTQGWFVFYNTSIPHWKYFWFD